MRYSWPHADVPVPGNLWPDEVVVDACRAGLTLDNQGPPTAGFAYLTQYRLLWLPAPDGNGRIVAPASVSFSQVLSLRKKQTLVWPDGLIIEASDHVYDLDLPFFLWLHARQVAGWYEALAGRLSAADLIEGARQREEPQSPLAGLSQRVLLLIVLLIFLARNADRQPSFLSSDQWLLLLVALVSLGIAAIWYATHKR